MKTAIHIGASKESVESARKAILEIMDRPHADEETKRKALDVLNTLCSVNNTTIQYCTFKGK